MKNGKFDIEPVYQEFREFWYTDEHGGKHKFQGRAGDVNSFLNLWSAEFSELDPERIVGAFGKSRDRFEKLIKENKLMEVGCHGEECLICHQQRYCLDEYGQCFACAYDGKQETPVCSECREDVDCVDEHGLCFNCHGKNPR